MTPSRSDATIPLSRCAAVIVAAGSGSRFGRPKHDLKVGGQPLWRRCCDVFEAIGIDQVVVVGDVPGGIPGGARRRDSVLAGVDAVPGAEWVLVHDAARPMITVDLVDRLLAAAAGEGVDGVVPGIPMTDTVKRIRDDVVLETIDRSDLVTVQTPQVFRRSVLVEGHRSAPGLDATDDAGLVELIGGTVVVVPGEATNIKITYPDDLDRARAIEEERGAG